MIVNVIDCQTQSRNLMYFLKAKNAKINKTWKTRWKEFDSGCWKSAKIRVVQFEYAKNEFEEAIKLNELT